MSYQPFAITEFKTGIFNYLQPWIRPIDAFEPMVNAYVYRGVLNKRAGKEFFGRMVYQDTIAWGNGGTTYSGTLITIPIVAGSFNPSAGLEVFTDNGNGTLTSNNGGTGTINYTSGAWSLTFGSVVSSNTPIIGKFSPNPATPFPIMGIKQWQDESDGSFLTVIYDTKRASYFNPSTKTVVPISTVNSQIIWIGDGSSSTITVNTGWVAHAPYTNILAPFSISITDGTSTITDDGSGNLSSSGNFAAGGTVSYSTGQILLNFVAPPATTVKIKLTATLTANYFSGDYTNFFNATNWQGNLYATNNKDQITAFDGTGLSRQPFSIDQSDYLNFVNNIGTCLDVQVYKNRFLVIYPTIINASSLNGADPQSIRWSAQFNPNNLVADVTGNGGELSAPTGDLIQLTKFLRDQFVVAFNNSFWIFRFTGTDFAPFRWEKINSSKSTNAPYGGIDYDERVTTMGAKGLIACDGVNVQRYDISVIDQFLEINQEAFRQCFGQRFDTLNQSWMLYPSMENNATTSDSVLVYNFLENTWSTYDLALSCLGIGQVDADKTWNDFAANKPLGQQFPNWNSAEFSWKEYFLQNLAPTLLGGGSDGCVYIMNVGTQDAVQDTATFTTITANITSKRWNPFIETGQKVQFGYIDFYYTNDPDTPSAEITLTFYTNNSEFPAAMRTLTLDGDVESEFSWKRIFINNVGQFLQMEMTSSSVANFQILGMVLWARPAGRLTP
jgi:hypothetical protein